MSEVRFPWKVTAEEEYAKDPNLKREDVMALQEWMQSQRYLPRVNEENICHFLHACYYDIEQAKKTIETFYTYKTTMPDFFNNWDPTAPDIQETINDILIAAPLPRLTKDGHRVIVCKLNDTCPDRFVYPLTIKWIMMSSIHAIWMHGITNGYEVVYDSAGYSMSHLLKCSMSTIRNYINYGQNASPIRVVRLVFVNTSPVVKKLMMFVKPFLNKELVNMMSFYTSPDSYFEGMDPELVPEDYGGSAPPLLSLHRDCVKRITASKQWLQEEEKLRVDESIKNGKSRKDSGACIEKSFKRLEID